jgi:hypothetical protein
MTAPAQDPRTVRPQAVAPSIRWVLQRATIGLLIMSVVTTLAAYLAYASIETSAEPAGGIQIGTPAARLLSRE